MKRSLIIFLALTTALCVVFIFSAARVFSFSDDVGYLNNDIYGSREALEDVRVDMTAELSRHHFWNTSVDLGAETEAETDYKFYYSEQNEEYVRHYELISISIENFMDYEHLVPNSDVSGEDIEAYANPNPYLELASRVGNGEERTETFYYKDYYEYYPIFVNVSIPNVYHYYGTDEFAFMERLGYVIYGDESDIRVFEETFKIPVLETDSMQITIGRNAQGDINHTGFCSGLEGESYFMYNTAVSTDDAVYFYIDAHTTADNIVDTSHFGIDFGVYILPFEKINENKTDVHYEKLSTFYPMDPAAKLLRMKLSDDNSRLLLTTVEDGAMYLTVISVADGSELQKLVIKDDDWFYNQFVYDDFIVYVFSDDHIGLLAELPDGTYDLRFVVSAPISELGGYEHSSPLSGAYVCCMEYNGEMLVIAQPIMDKFSVYYETCSFYVAAMDETGLLYFGEYLSSLTGDYYGGDAFRSLCQIRDMTIVFE